MFCPHCGFKNNPNNNFCKRCGFNLAQYRQDLRKKRMGASTTPSPRPMRSMRSSRSPKRKHHLAIITAVIIVVILIVGVGTYATHSWPFNNGPLSSVNQNASNEDVVTPIDQMWTNVQSQANGNSTSLAKFFTTGTSNYGYQQVNNWSNDQNKVESLSKVTLDPTIISKKISGNQANVKYKVAYRFEYNDGSEKDQTFIWFAHLKQQNGKWLIASNNPNNKPVSNN